MLNFEYIGNGVWQAFSCAGDDSGAFKYAVEFSGWEGLFRVEGSDEQLGLPAAHPFHSLRLAKAFCERHERSIPLEKTGPSKDRTPAAAQEDFRASVAAFGRFVEKLTAVIEENRVGRHSLAAAARSKDPIPSSLVHQLSQALRDAIPALEWSNANQPDPILPLPEIIFHGRKAIGAAEVFLALKDTETA